MSMNAVRLTQAQVPDAIATLTLAFNQDPLFRYLFDQDDQTRLSQIRWLSDIFLRYCRPFNQIYTTPEHCKGVAIWLPPEQFPLNDWRLLQLGLYKLPFMLELRHFWQIFSMFNAIEHHHTRVMPEPHWYLFMLGVSPDAQSQGVGSSLLQPVLQQADADGFWCYLETSTERAVRFYQKHGFEIISIGKATNTAPPYWAMKRPPVNQRKP